MESLQPVNPGPAPLKKRFHELYSYKLSKDQGKKQMQTAPAYSRLRKTTWGYLYPQVVFQVVVVI